MARSPARALGARFAVALVLSSTVNAQRFLYQMDGAATGEEFGYSLDSGGNVGGTAAADVLVGSPWFPVGGASVGRVTVLDGSDGSTLSSVVGQSSDAQFGRAVVFVEDIDADGNDELLVGEPYRTVAGLGWVGCARMFAGASGLELQSVCGSATDTALGFSVDAVGDIDGDGRQELLIGDLFHDELGHSNAGRALVISGLAGTELSAFYGVHVNQYLGQSVCALGDVDLDGVDDLAIAAPGESVGGVQYVGAVHVHSGATGSVLRVVPGNLGGDVFGTKMARAGDLDRDGVSDLIIGSYLSAHPALAMEGRAVVVSGFTGEVVLETQPPDASSGELYGWSVAGDFDFNGDGDPDVAVGAPSASGPAYSTGRALVFSGRDGRVLLDAYGEHFNSSFGFAVAGLTDVHGDGADELIVGAPRQQVVGVGTPGAARVYAGEPRLWFSHHGRAGSVHGAALAPAGDFDADGVGDVIAGAPLEEPPGTMDRGAARVLSGRTGRELARYAGSSNGERLGSAVCTLGDLDADGVPDYALGAPYDTASGQGGRVRVVSGASGTLLYTLTGPTGATNDLFGAALANVGDLDGDTLDDLVVGAENDSSGGGSYGVYSGADGSWLGGAGPATPGLRLGSAVRGWVDFDGDGKRDFAVAALGYGGGAGWVRVYSGLVNGAALSTYSGASAGDQFGDALADVGDLDGDGKDELAIGAPGVDVGANTDAGRVYVYSGSTGQLLRTIDGIAAGERFGKSITAIGDFDCDGTPELAIGGGVTPSNAGFVRVFSGASGAAITGFTGVELFSGFGNAVTSPGDIDGDGRADLVVGAPFASSGEIADCGHVKVYTLNPRFVQPERYCAAKANSLGCAPSISYSGSPQIASGCDDFHVLAGDVIPQTTGYLLVGTGRNTASSPAPSGARPRIGPSPGGGVNCVFAPHSLAPQRSGGTPGTCSGSFDLPFTQALMSQLGLAAGDDVFVQWWYSDPAHPDGSGIGHTDALHFVIAP